MTLVILEEKCLANSQLALYQMQLYKLASGVKKSKSSAEENNLKPIHSVVLEETTLRNECLPTQFEDVKM